nr:Chain B, nsp4/5 peptidyl substrate [Severe acute respiratory syndrome coronavirus 2]
TSAVLQSGFR